MKGAQKKILSIEEVERLFASELQANGFGEHIIPADGEWHDFEFPDSKAGKKHGSAKLNYEEEIDGVVIDRRRGNKPILVWRPNQGTPRSFTDAEHEARKIAFSQKMKAQTERQEEARRSALELFAKLPSADPNHLYLKKKGIKEPHPLKADGNALVVPIYNASTGKLQSIQRIWPNGDKRFPKNGVKAMGCAMPGSIGLNDLKRWKKNKAPIVIAEGYATAAAIRKATFYRVLAAMDCGNLGAVAVVMRKRFPLLEIIIAADNDENTDGNPGVTAAMKAALAAGPRVKVAVPPPGDFVDLLLADGEEAVAALINDAQVPPANWDKAFGVSDGKARVDRPVIEVKAGDLSEIAYRGENVLLEAGVSIYQRAGSLVRPIIEEVEAAHGRRTKVAQLTRIETTYLRDVLSREARWIRIEGRSKRKPIDPPVEVASTILARAGEWKFDTIAGVITTPTMRQDGTILDRPGYDPATRLLLVEPPSMPSISSNPTRQDALRALNLLNNLLKEFPLSDEVARSVALAAMITPVVRGAFPVTPMYAARAPVAASGKSYLFDVVAALAIGQPMPVMAAGRNEEETEKRLGAALMTGQPLISIDNLNGELFGDALCQIIERPVVDIRILGKSERVRIEARGTTLFCTGNNILLVGDLCRRALIATLDPRVERPELREFKGNPVADVMANRGNYIAAALTICRAYIAAGRPNRAPRLASFEGWSDTVRSALVWLGKADPVGSMELARAEDPELAALRDVLEAWADTIGIGYKHRVTLQEVIDLIQQTTQGRNMTFVPAWPEFYSAIQAVAGRRAPADAQRLGAWARGRKDRVVGDLRLVNKPDPKGASEWWLEHRDEIEKAGKRDKM